MSQAPREILIVGAGVFGLSTALSLLCRPQYGQSQITIVDSSPSLPNPHGSSVDSSRIIRADYGSKPYAKLASQAQEHWRDLSPSGWGGEGRYHETGFVLTADTGAEHYVLESLKNVRDLAEAGFPLDGDKIEQLDDKEAIGKATGHPGVSGDLGYANWNSGWAHAERCVDFAIRKVKAEGGERVVIKSGVQVARLLVDSPSASPTSTPASTSSVLGSSSPSVKPCVCNGVVLASGETIRADLTILAAGAWTPSLVNLKGRCLATGQALTYVRISPEEQKALGDRPVVMNMSRGMFIIPPQNRELKVARHGFGYRHLQKFQYYDGTEDEVSAPKYGATVPLEAQNACRTAMAEMLPHIADHPFFKTRICWYCDTPDGNFLIDHHPTVDQLIVATGGSGHGFKFFPVIGDRIVDVVEGTADAELKHIWRWRDDKDIDPDFVGCNDGSRGGAKGMVLDEELSKS